MSKKFKKGQKVMATLPTGEVVEGTYLEPYGEKGHSLIVTHFTGIGKGGKPTTKKVRYGVSEEFIVTAPDKEDDNGLEPLPQSYEQYRNWLEQVAMLKARIEDAADTIDFYSMLSYTDEAERATKKMERFTRNMKVLERKIAAYEHKNA